MLTIRPMSSGEGYSANYLEQSDYLSEHHKIEGRWYGQGAERLGLKGPVVAEDFEAVREGVHPLTGDKLRPRQSANRIDPNGKVVSQGRELYDLTISAPKSVSIMACIGGDKRILEVHERAVKEALLEAERCAQTRVRKENEQTNRFTRNLVTASYTHDASRDLDPQIHTHNATLNSTYDPVENRWKALQMGRIYQAQSCITEIYRNKLARGLEEIGFETEYRWDSKHADRNVEIKAISPELCRKFSQMSQRRDDAIAGFMAEHGRMPTHNEETILMRRVRPEKQNHLSPDEVHQKQLDRCTPEDLAMIAEAWHKSYSYVRPPQEANVELSVQHALEHTFERVSVAQDFEIVEEALRHSRGRASHDQIKAHLRELEKKGQVFTHQGEIATEESLRREKGMIGLVNEGRGRYEALGRWRDFTPDDRLTPQQRAAVEFILDSRDFATNLRGAPGTGKTWSLRDIKRGLEQAERPILAVAPTKGAEEELRKVGFAQAMTVEGLLQSKDAPLRIYNSVLLIDEAGMVGARSMFELLSLAARCGARVLFSGDSHQINSVEAGDSLRILEKESKLRESTAELTEPQRQKNVPYSEAIKTLRENPDKGFDQLEAQGAVKEVSDLDRPAAVAQARREAEAKGTTIVVCPTHAEIAAVTGAIRADRRAHDELGEEQTFTRLEPLNFTLAEKKDFRNYEAGMRLVFHRPTVDAKRHEIFEILSVKDNAVLVRGQDGNETEVTQKQTKSFGVFAAREIQIAPGDLLMLQQNRRSPDLRATNGEIAAVKQITPEGHIELEGGRILADDYQCFTYGYASTAHKAQGKTVDHVIVSGNEMDRRQFYVATSRGRESIQVFTENIDDLRDSIGVSGTRQSATELAARAMEESVEQARREMWWVDYETGELTRDATRAQPQPGATRGTSRTEREGRYPEMEYSL